jgi:hypothetical protein
MKSLILILLSASILFGAQKVVVEKVVKADTTITIKVDTVKTFKIDTIKTTKIDTVKAISFDTLKINRTVKDTTVLVKVDTVIAKSKKK